MMPSKAPGPSRTRFAIATLLALAVVLIPRVALAAGGGDDWSQYADDGYLSMYLASFGFGVLTSLTPCVYPMIPIIVGIFGARDEAVTRRRAFGLASAYVLGMGLLFATLGLIFAMLGKKSGFGTLLANPWVVIPLVGFYALLAASMFGAFEMNLPAGLQARLNAVGGKGFAGAFGLGMVGGLTAAPCTGPFLAGMIAWVAAEGNPFVGFTLMFTYALGIGMLFFAVAVFSVSLPRSGRWMEWVKSFGGIALLAAGFYFLRPVLPMESWSKALHASSTGFLAVSIALLAVGVAIGAVHLSFHDRALTQLRKGTGIVLAVAGISGGVTWLVTPDRYLPWVYDEQVAFSEARAESKGVMVDFSAKWCTPCKELELTFSDAEVFDHLIANYVPLKFDVSDDTHRNEELQDKYDAANLPAVIFLDADGHEHGRVRKYLAPGDFLDVVRPATEQIKNPVAASGP
jgi:thioredoxin:protein disulfide reductase